MAQAKWKVRTLDIVVVVCVDSGGWRTKSSSTSTIAGKAAAGLEQSLSLSVAMAEDN